MTWWQIGLTALELAAIGWGFAFCFRCGYEAGSKEGWDKAQEWIIKMETEVDQARQEIWREER